jgi:hypothetical protein
MKKYFLPFEESKIIKGLGFNEPCYGVYGYSMTDDMDYPKEIRERLVLLDEISLTEGCHMTPDDIKNSDIGSDVSAPLICQVIDWFRNAKGLVGEVQTKNIGHIGYTFNIRDLSSGYYYSHPITGKDYNVMEFQCIRKMLEMSLVH